MDGTMEWAIEAENVVKNYGSIRALDHLDLKVRKGESFGFLGPNGAGKTTFVKILLHLIAPSEGKITIMGHDCSQASARKKVGFLPENCRVYPFLTVEEFLTLHAKLIGIPRMKRNQEVTEWLKKMGMDKERKRKMGTLSKGMTQRVVIAQALLNNPALLLLDEPTSGLDPIGIKELREILLELQANGTTIFLNSHLLSEIERTCDRVAILHRGKIMRSGNKADLSAKIQHLEVIAEGFTEKMAQDINLISIKDIVKQGKVMKIYLKNKDDAITVHQIIAGNGGRLLSLAWQGESLEDAFYKIVKEGES